MDLFNFSRLAPVISAIVFFLCFFFFFFFFFVILYHFLLLYLSLIHFTVLLQKLSFPLWDITYQIIISCTGLYTFEEKTLEKIESGDKLNFQDQYDIITR